jgi:radical SAM protein (TIGR01212 family)
MPNTTSKPRWHTFKAAMQARYGSPLFRIPLDAGGTCPHRAPDGSGGCAFCAEDGARAVQTQGATTLREQCDAGIDFARRRYGATQFMGYLQTYTNTLDEGPLASGELAELATEYALPAVTVATRPDCLGPQAIAHLQALSRVTDVFVELGIQSTSDEALAGVNRGHDWGCGRKAILDLHAAKLNPIAHLILGLPGESEADMLAGAKELGQLPLSGVKLHNLHVIRHTALARRYASAPFPLFTPYAYAELLLHYLQYLPADLPVLRLCTDTAAPVRLAPNWDMDKGAFTAMLARLMSLRGVRQGDALVPTQWQCPEGYRVTLGQDGSPTLFVPDPGTHTHPPIGSIQSAQRSFITPALLGERLCPGQPHALLDAGAGMGTNTLCACEVAAARGTPLHVTALDYDRHLLELACAHLSPPPGAQLDWHAILESIRQHGHYSRGNITINWIEGDLRHTLPTLTAGPFHTIFYDPYPLPYNPDLWSETAAQQIRAHLAPDGRLITRKAPHTFRC